MLLAFCCNCRHLFFCLSHSYPVGETFGGMAVDYCPYRRGPNLPRTREMMLYPRHAMRRQYNRPPWTRLDTPCIRKGGSWMHGECIYRAIMNFNAFRRYLSAPLPAQRLSGLSYEKYFMFYEFSHSGKAIIFRNRKFVK